MKILCVKCDVKKSAALNADSILKDVNSTMRGESFESANFFNGVLRLEYIGKTSGDSFGFNESYRNGKFKGGHSSDKWQKVPFFDKQAKYIYEKYKIADIEISGSFE